MTNPTAEPPDGTRLVIEDPDGHLTVIWRDDIEALRWDRKCWDNPDAVRWFDHPTTSPADWVTITHDALKIYTLTPYTGEPTGNGLPAGSIPPAVFSGSNQ